MFARIFKLLLWCLIPVPAAAAQVSLSSQAAQIRLSGRVQTQFNTTSVDGEPASDFLIRRARFSAEVTINDFVSGKVEPEYGEGRVQLRDAYLRLSFGPAFRVTAGQFKRPFDLFELTSSTQILVIERAGDIRGVNACAGPGGVCSFSRLTERLQFADRDIGVMVDGADRSGRLSYFAAITNGAGQNQRDENGAKSFTARARFVLADGVAVAGNLALHDYVAAGGDARAAAWGGDLEIGNFDEGLHVQAGLVAGENWRNLTAGDPSTFLAVQGIVTYKSPVSGSRYLEAVEPVGRVSWSDPALGGAADGGWLFTPGIVLHFAGRNKLAVNVDLWRSSAVAEWSLKIQSYLYF
ncbi:MAG: hypothetical protein KatS3mg081_1526 [Gemmatimonadales bacterium]|nr:MAG: hypothetical protein KatS3mg081_1526 [Gemmatimonadales bacterium]